MTHQTFLHLLLIFMMSPLDKLFQFWPIKSATLALIGKSMQLSFLEQNLIKLLTGQTGKALLLKKIKALCKSKWFKKPLIMKGRKC